MSTAATDERHMRHALALARQGLGLTGLNPAVGCVLVKEGRVIGRGRTANGGRPHAEVAALEMAGAAAQGATAYVTLEPCAHHGKTPPCTGALIGAGVARVVAACEDPDPRVSGRGIRQLRCAGIQVDTGILEAEAKAHHQGFILRTVQKRPLVTLKMATTADGKILPGKDGKPRWVTDPLARRRGHLERSFHDAILVGIGTVLADDPLLTTRLPGVDHKITRVVLDRKLRLPVESKLVKTASEFPLYVFHSVKDEKPLESFRRKAGAGVELFYLEMVKVEEVLRILAQRGVMRLLVEGGSQIHGAFVRAGFCDRLLWFRGSRDAGKDGIPPIEDFAFDEIIPKFNLTRKKMRALDEDVLEIYEREA